MLGEHFSDGGHGGDLVIEFLEGGVESVGVAVDQAGEDGLAIGVDDLSFGARARASSRGSISVSI